MPTLHCKASMLRWAHGTVAYLHAESHVYIEAELSQEEWEGLQEQMRETDALIAYSLEEEPRG